MKRPGIYAPLSAHYFDDEAIMEAGEHAELMFVRMLAFAARTPTTEGHLSRAVCLTRLGIVSSENDPETYPEKRLERLRETGLVTATDTGFQINSWLRWNPSSEQLGRERSRDRERKAAQKPAVTRGSSENGPENGPENAPESGPVSGARSEGQIDRSDRSDAQSAASDDAPDRFEEFWDTYGKKVDRKKAEQKYKLALKKRNVTADLLISSARSYVEFQRREGKHPQFTKDPATWLNNESWNNELASRQPDIPQRQQHEDYEDPFEKFNRLGREQSRMAQERSA